MASSASSLTRAPSNDAPAASASARPQTQVTVVTSSDDFLLELGEALAGQAAVHPVESLAEALPLLADSRRGQVLVVDARGIVDLRTEVARAQAEAPGAIVLVFAEAATETQVGASLKGSNVFAVLAVPLDKDKSEAVLAGALAEALEKKTARPSEPLATVTVEPFSPQSVSQQANPTSPLPTRTALWAAVAVGVVAIAGATYYFVGRHGQTTAGGPQKAASAVPSTEPTAADAALAPQPAVETSLVKGKVDDLLEKARAAMRERRYTEPAGDNALLYYRSAAAADPSNGEAADGLQRVAGALASRFEESMSGSRYDEAAAALANLKVAAPKDARIAPLELRLTTAQISKAIADGNLDKAAALLRFAQQSSAIPADQINRWRMELARHQEDAKLQKLSGLIGDRIRDGKLVEPAGDSAKDYLEQLRQQAAAAPVTQRLAHDLNLAYLHRAREATLANRSSEAERWLAEARAGGMTAAEIAAYQHEVSSARQKAVAAESERIAQLARDRIRDARLTDPQDSAASYIAQLQASDPTYTGLGPLAHDLAAKLLERARGAAQGGQSAQADADLAAAKRWGADPSEILEVQQIESSAAASATASRAGSGVSLAALAETLKRTHYVAPEYPDKALNSHVAGSVTVGFTVGANGQTRDVHVIDSSPAGVFDDAAVAAIKRWRYAPVLVNGKAVEVPVKLAVRFELPK